RPRPQSVAGTGKAAGGHLCPVSQSVPSPFPAAWELRSAGPQPFRSLHRSIPAVVHTRLLSDGWQQSRNCPAPSETFRPISEDLVFLFAGERAAQLRLRYLGPDVLFHVSPQTSAYRRPSRPRPQTRPAFYQRLPNRLGFSFMGKRRHFRGQPLHFRIFYIQTHGRILSELYHRKKLPLVGFKDLFPQTDRKWRDFHHLVFAHELNRLLQIQQAWRHQTDRFVSRRSAHIRELLLFNDVHVKVGGAGILTNDHAFINLSPGRNENLAALLKIEDCIACRFAGTIRHQRTSGAGGDFSLPFDVAVEERIQNSRSTRVRQNLTAQTDQTARRDMELQTHAPRAVVDHLAHLAFAAAELFDHYPDERLRRINHEHFDRLQI